MGETGILHEDDRVELLEGVLYEMPLTGDWHDGTVDVVSNTFVPPLGGRAIVRVQGSFRLTGGSEPEPDVLVLRYRPDFYRSTKVGPEDVLLLVEVAHSSLPYDRDFKLPLYARAGIPEVWIVNHDDQRVEVYRDPEGDGYRSATLVERGGTVAPLAFPDLAIAVDDILG